MFDEDRDYEHSCLCGSYTFGDEMLEVEIYRTAGTQGRWHLEVIHLSGGCIKWNDTFATEADAYAAFIAMVEAVGSELRVRDRPAAVH